MMPKVNNNIQIRIENKNLLTEFKTKDKAILWFGPTLTENGNSKNISNPNSMLEQTTKDEKRKLIK